jgi:hypothetical protein
MSLNLFDYIIILLFLSFIVLNPQLRVLESIMQMTIFLPIAAGHKLPAFWFGAFVGVFGGLSIAYLQSNCLISVPVERWY